MSTEVSKTANLLVELLVEELPPKALKKLGESFAATLTESLVSQGLADANTAVIHFATPRRLGVRVEAVLARATDKPMSTKLMPVNVGLDADGKATPALVKRLVALGANESALSQLRRAADGKSQVLFYDSIAAGTTLTDGLQRALEAAMAKLPIPKMMTYQLADGWTTVNFVRPVHGLVALHGTDVVPISVLGLQAGRGTLGHRFEARVHPVSIQSADSYASQLMEEGAVIASFAERRGVMVRQLQAAAEPLGLKPIKDDALLDEVTALVERPRVLLGQFEESYLDVPQECLILTMKANQKYFPLLDKNGKLTNRFLIVSNISPDDTSAVVQGNERVVRPRLADARFFFDQDRKKALASRVPGLDKVVYHNKLGTQGKRVMRVQAIARAIGEKLGGETLALKADQAALLAKADLLTDMVGEFPELQGIMGRYYAQHDGYTADIAFAIEDHYKPRFAGDELPSNDVGVCVALADKLESLIGLFGIGQTPSGDKDPFALRRHALGVIRLLVEKDLPLSLDALIQNTANEFKGITGFENWRATEESQDFIEDRLAGNLREQGYSAQEVDAVLALHPPVLADIPRRLVAVRAFAKLPEAPALAAVNKRVGNILKKAEVDRSVNSIMNGGENKVFVRVDISRFVEPAETALYSALAAIQPIADAAFDTGDYSDSLRALSGLKAPVDAFFDQVMVNADDPALKANRLALLRQLHQTMNRVADISRLAA